MGMTNEVVCSAGLVELQLSTVRRSLYKLPLLLV